MIIRKSGCFYINWGPFSRRLGLFQGQLLEGIHSVDDIDP